MFTISDLEDVRLDLLEVPMQFDALESYIMHLESHNEWPRRVEEQKVAGSQDDLLRMSAMDEIEHKYSVVLPLRQRFSYVTQLTSLVEWSAKKILAANHTSVPPKVKFEPLLDLLTKNISVDISNRKQLRDLYKVRNQIVHENGIISSAEIEEWNHNELCKTQRVSDENFLLIEMDQLSKCIADTRMWTLELRR